VTGQKVWSTGAATADFGLLLARTDASVPKHRGITCFVLPMRQPGVEVRPPRQMNGHASFNEVFLDRAEVPADHVIGEPGGGWTVALSVLAHERRLAASRPAPAPAGAAGRAWPCPGSPTPAGTCRSAMCPGSRVMAYLDRDGIPVYYQVSGAQNGNLPVLLSHGFAASSQMWEPNVEALAAARPVVSWDLDEARQRWNDYAIGQAGRLERDGLAAFGESPRPATRGTGRRRAWRVPRAAFSPSGTGASSGRCRRSLSRPWCWWARATSGSWPRPSTWRRRSPAPCTR
jgi:hypothetical protein